MTIPSSHNTPSLRNTTLCSTQASCNFDEDTGSRHLEIGVGERQASSQLPKTAPCVQGWPRILQPYKFSYLFQKKSEKKLVQQISTRKKITLPIFLRITTAVQECCSQISLFLFVLCVFFFCTNEPYDTRLGGGGTKKQTCIQGRYNPFSSDGSLSRVVTRQVNAKRPSGLAFGNVLSRPLGQNFYCYDPLLWQQTIIVCMVTS